MRGNRSLKAVQAIVADNHGVGTVNGTGIFLPLGAHDWLRYLVSVGTPGASATLDVKVQEADDSNGAAGTYTDVASGALAQQTTAAGLKVILVDPRKVKAWSRLVFVVGTAAYDAGAIAVLGDGKSSQPEAAADLTIGFA